MKRLIQLLTCSIFLLGLINSSGAQNTCTASYTFSVSGNTVQFTNNSTGGPYYSWDFGDNTYSNTLNPSHTYSMPGSYMVCLTVYDSMQTCWDTFCDSIMVGNASCNAYFTYQASSVSSPVYFYNASTGGNTYYWNFGDNATSTSANPNHLYAGPGTYNVCLTIVNNSTNCIDTFCTNVTVGQNSCSASFTYTVNGNTVQFANTSTGGGSYSWDFGDNSTSGQMNPAHTYNGNGIYMVCLTVWDSTCQDSYCDSIQVGTMGIDEALLITGLATYPNPFNDIVSVSFELGQGEDMEIAVFDMLGKNVEIIASGKRPAGKHTVQWDGSAVQRGIYLLKMTTSQGSAVKLLTKY